MSTRRLSQADLNILGGKDEAAHIRFLRDRGLEIAQFLCWIITELKIPQANADHVSGGMMLAGWSLGNLFTTAFLAHLATYPSEIIRTLESYLRSFVTYAPPYMFLGYPNPPDAYNPLYLPENPKRIAPPTFAAWVTAYYKHPAYTAPPPSSNLTPASFKQYLPEQPYRASTTDTMSADELSNVTDLEPNARSERFYFDMAPSMLHNMMEKALLGADKCLLPAIKVSFIYGLEDVWVMIWAACEFEKDLLKWKAEGEYIRPIKVVPVPGANHAMHWDDARTFLQIIMEHAQSQTE